MADKDLVLSLDLGTQSIRGFVFDTEGNMLHSECTHLPEYISTEPGYAEMEGKAFTEALVDVCQSFKKNAPEVFARIGAVTAACMRDSLLLLDEKGDAIRPCIVWLDRRKTDKIRPEKGIWPLLLKIVGVSDMVKKSAQISYSNWLLDNEPENWHKAYKIVQLPSFINYWLCGKYLDTASNQAGHIAFDSRRFNWCMPGDVKYDAFPYEREKMVDIVEPGAVIGTVRPECSLLTGLPTDVKVVACGSDKACETLGCGCATDNIAVLSFGSQTTIQTTIHKYYEVENFVPSFAAAVPGCWNAEQQIYRGFWMVRWFMENIGEKSVLTSENGEEITNEYLDDTPPGSDGLIVYPYWGGCVRYPDSSGAIVGFKDYHTRPFIYRALLEGIGYTLKEAMMVMEKKRHKKMDYLIASGGGSRSEAVCQMMASIINRPVVRVNTSEATGLGASMTGYVALGKFTSFEEAASRMTSFRDRFEPIKDDVKIYKKLYKKYQKKKDSIL